MMFRIRYSTSNKFVGFLQVKSKLLPSSKKPCDSTFRLTIVKIRIKGAAVLALSNDALRRAPYE